MNREMGCLRSWVNREMDGWIEDGWMDDRNGWMGGWVDGWMDGWRINGGWVDG